MAVGENVGENMKLVTGEVMTEQDEMMNDILRRLHKTWYGNKRGNKNDYKDP